MSLVRCTYQEMICRIAHAGQLLESFDVKVGVCQGCQLSPFIFLLVIDWIMKTTTTDRNNGIQWRLWTQLDDLVVFADDPVPPGTCDRQAGGGGLQTEKSQQELALGAYATSDGLTK